MGSKRTLKPGYEQSAVQINTSCDRAVEGEVPGVAAGHSTSVSTEQQWIECSGRLLLQDTLAHSHHHSVGFAASLSHRRRFPFACSTSSSFSLDSSSTLLPRPCALFSRLSANSDPPPPGFASLTWPPAIDPNHRPRTSHQPLRRPAYIPRLYTPAPRAACTAPAASMRPQ